MHININHTIWGKIYNYFIQFSKAFKTVIKKILMLRCLWLVRFSIRVCKQIVNQKKNNSNNQAVFNTQYRQPKLCELMGKDEVVAKPH